MRAILVRLYRIEHQVEDALVRSLPPGYQTFQEDSSSHVRLPIEGEEGNALNAGNNARVLDHDVQAQEWTEEYRLIREVVHDVSEKFGPQMLTGFFFFLCEATSMITLLWEEAGETLGLRGTVALMVCFVANAVMICAVFHFMAFLVVESCHHIGPKVAILAVRCHGEAPRYQVLASAFLHAPPKIHIGVFEVGPEYASVVFLWFLGLFLLVFGLKMPGAE